MLIVAVGVTTGCNDDARISPDARVTTDTGTRAPVTNSGVTVPMGIAEERPPVSPPEISPPAREALDRMAKAYADVRNAEFGGVIFANLRAVGGTNDVRHRFNSAYQAPNKFRHVVEDQFEMGSTGERTYVYNKSANAYLTNAPLAGKAEAGDLPAPIVEFLQTQNPSLLFALLMNPVQDLTNGFHTITREDDVTVDGVAYTTLGLIPRRGTQKLTLLLDPKTHLLRQLSVDLNPATISDRVTNEFRRSTLTEIIYTNINTSPEFAAQHFAWTPPQGAKDIAAASRTESPDTLVGKPAPAFTLATLDGSSSVSLADLKGQVVVLDFWASWCPPCVAALPHLGKLYKEKLGTDVKIYAVNVQEDRSVVRNFIQSKDLQVPVLMDASGTVAEQYGVESLPRTFVIGKNGVIAEVFTGLGEDTFTQLRAAINAAETGRVPVREQDGSTNNTPTE